MKQLVMMGTLVGSWTDVRVRPEELSCPDGSERLCYRVAELDPEEAYQIQVAAHTRDGDWGDFTAPLVVSTGQAEIPVLESHMRIAGPLLASLSVVTPVHQCSYLGVAARDSESITVEWEGLDPSQTKNLAGYVLEHSEGQSGNWKQFGGIVPIGPERLHRVRVTGLRPDTPYFFRLKVHPHPFLHITSSLMRLTGPRSDHQRVHCESV